MIFLIRRAIKWKILEIEIRRAQIQDHPDQDGEKKNHVTTTSSTSLTWANSTRRAINHHKGNRMIKAGNLVSNSLICHQCNTEFNTECQRLISIQSHLMDRNLTPKFWIECSNGGEVNYRQNSSTVVLQLSPNKPTTKTKKMLSSSPISFLFLFLWTIMKFNRASLVLERRSCRTRA